MLVTSVLLSTSIAHGVTIIPADQDVMTSAFFQGENRVRGYAGDGRSSQGVSTDNAFGTGPETTYITFDYDFAAGFIAAVEYATLTVQATDRGFGANAGPDSPFTVSAHAVNADPLTSITDDTNPEGTIGWLDFFNNHILAATPEALTVVQTIDGAVSFDVTSIVQDWVSGENSVHALALTGKNDTSGTDFLHGFLNNSENPGSTFLAVTLVPEPNNATAACLLTVLCASWLRRRRTNALHA